MAKEFESYSDRWMHRYREEHGIPESRISEHPIERFDRASFSTVPESTAEQSNSQVYEGGRNENRCISDPVVLAAIQTRKELRLTQTSFARYLKISPRTLRDWEQGRRQPSGAALTLLEWVVESPGRIREVHRKEKAEARIRWLIGGE